ncbi:hypothetical protein RS84_02048 [Microbacterium hydrocarbonoxydans]|uniref:Uncharacterized protein n=1 Tax=Microbacterium hydrocarbonoxydans TaxID=273678 RepID=A0A0M2HS11_9MICO|nr:hypothetical protein [Microbacterium hydrocarbonoxydans]KJL47258.1 hypothetical protein RS84_02048 [Microbacterium hydrocarbonoxydans]
MTTLRHVGIGALAVVLAIIEVLALAFTAIVMTLVVVAAFIVRACADAAERRRLRRGRRAVTVAV